MPHTLEDIKKELKQIQDAVECLPAQVFKFMDVDKFHQDDLKIASLMYAPDHSLLYLCGFIGRSDAELCQMEYRDIQKAHTCEADKFSELNKPYYKYIEDLAPRFKDIFARLQDSDINLSLPIKNKFIKDIKNLRRAAALYELTFLNMRDLKYDVNDILPYPSQKELTQEQEEFDILWQSALVLNGLSPKAKQSHLLLGVLASQYFYDAAAALYDVEEDKFNPGVQFRARQMAAYFQGLIPQKSKMGGMQTRGVMCELIKQVRHELHACTHDKDWQSYLTSWYDTRTGAFMKRQPEIISHGRILKNLNLGASLKRRAR